MFTRLLSGLGKTMIALGVITFLFVAFQLWGTELEESRAQNDLTADLVDSLPADTPKVSDDAEELDKVAASLGAIDPADVKKLPKPAEGDSLGIIQFKPDLNKAGIDMRKVFVEGTNKDDLKKGGGTIQPVAEEVEPEFVPEARQRPTAEPTAASVFGTKD